MEKNADFEIIKQKLSDDSYVYAVQIHWGIGKRITLQTVTEIAALDLLEALSSGVCWIEDD